MKGDDTAALRGVAGFGDGLAFFSTSCSRNELGSAKTNRDLAVALAAALIRVLFRRSASALASSGLIGAWVGRGSCVGGAWLVRA